MGSTGTGGTGGGGCAVGLVDCAGACVDTQADGSNCGTCGVACATGELCSGGTCTAAGCPGAELECAQACVDVQTNSAHCGACDQPCAAGEQCMAGSCQCPIGQTCGDGTGGNGGSGGATSTPSTTGMANTTGMAGSGGTGVVVGDNPYPCDGDTSGYDAVMTQNGNSWQVTHGGSNVYNGSSMHDAMQAAVNSLSGGRSSKESVIVVGSGTMSAGERVELPSYTILNVCGTINVQGSGSGDMAPIYARGRTDIEIPNVSITGTPLYGMFFRDVENLHLRDIDLELSDGEGIRIDNHGRSDRSDKVENITLDYVYVSGSGHHGVETYGVNNITIGTVIARSTTNCGLLLNDTTNAEVGLVDGDDVATGTGYAVFRMANRNGRINDQYPTNIHVGQVIARGGGRGVFCVSESGGAVIDHVDIANTGNNSILLENCYNVNIAAVEGTVSGGGDVRIAARDEFANSSDITIQNLTVENSALNESPCATNSQFLNNTLVNSSDNTCN